MSELRNRLIKAQIDFERRSKMTTTVSIVVCVGLLALMLLLVSSMSLALGTAPERDVLRRGTVRIDGCRIDPTQLWTAQVCIGSVTWEPEDRWIKGQLDFPTTTRVAVLSRTPLSGVVDVESHRVSWRSGSSKGASTLNEDEVLLPAGQFRPAGAGVGIAVVAACIVIPVGFGLLVSWVGTRHTHRLYKKAVDKAPEGPSGG